jgi:serine/threonine protein kinase
VAPARRSALEEPAIATATVPTLRSPADGTSGIGDRIGKYEVIREVGRGSTGTVSLSHDPDYGRDVAIKAHDFLLRREPSRIASAQCVPDGPAVPRCHSSTLAITSSAEIRFIRSRRCAGVTG